MNYKQFNDYCWSFYAPGEMYGYFFSNKLTRDQLQKAISLHIDTVSDFSADSFDREQVRDLLLLAMKRSNSVTGVNEV